MSKHLLGFGGHFIRLCKVCGKVICQCRCPDPDKRKEYDVCDDCKKTTVDKMKEDTLGVHNVEETIQKAIKAYFDRGLIVDALFWKNAINFLKLKLKGEKT
jgi:hypothetical protein